MHIYLSIYLSIYPLQPTIALCVSIYVPYSIPNQYLLIYISTRLSVTTSHRPQGLNINKNIRIETNTIDNNIRIATNIIVKNILIETNTIVNNIRIHRNEYYCY